MLLPDKTGIKCDKCNKTLKTQFVYYSYDIHDMKMNNNILHTANTAPTESVDLCAECDEQIRNSVIANYKPTRVLPGNMYPQGIYCDLSGKLMSGSLDMVLIIVNEVNVNIPNVTVNKNIYEITALQESVNLLKPSIQDKELTKWE